jgi:hypothetical protein
LRQAIAFKVQGFSLNLDYKIVENALWRIEGRYFRNATPFFQINTQAAHAYAFLTTALVISF